MAREDGCEPKITRQCGIGSLDRRGDVIAVATAVMVRIPFVAIGRHLVGVPRRMAHGNFVHACSMRCHAYIWPFQHMRRRSRPHGENDHQVSKDVQQSSHDSRPNRKADNGIVKFSAKRMKLSLRNIGRAGGVLSLTPGSPRGIPAHAKRRKMIAMTSQKQYMAGQRPVPRIVVALSRPV